MESLRVPLTLPFGSRVVGAAFLSQALAVGLPISAYPVFIASIESELGASRTQASLGIPLILVTGALIGPKAGRLIDAGGARTVMAAGAILLGIGFASLAWAPGLAVAALLWIALVGPGYAALGPHPAMTVLARWFVARRGRVIAIAAMGTTAGGAVTPALAQTLIESVGWRGALTGFGALAVGIGLPVVLGGILDSPERIGAHPDGAPDPPAEEPGSPGDRAEGSRGGGMLRDPRFWLLATAFGLMTGCSVGYVTHVVEWAGDSGLGRDAAVRVLVVNAIFAAAGKLAFGAITDRVGARGASLAAVALQVAGWTGMIASSAPGPFTVSAALFSFGVGCIIPCQAGFVAAIWGRARFGEAAGLLTLVAIFGPLLIPVAVGIAFDALGGYAWPMRVMGVAIALPALAFAAVRPRVAAPAEAPG